MAETRPISKFLDGSALAETIKRASEALRKQEAEFGADATTPNARTLRKERLRLSGIPLEGHVRRRVIEDTLEHTPALDAVRPAVVAASKGHTLQAFIGLLGERGRGKTTSGGWAIAELGGLYVKLERASQLRKRERVADAHEWDSMLRAPVLVVDELGAERSAVDGELAFLDIVDERQDFGRITIIGSNLSQRDIQSRYDPRIIDRLRSVWRPVELAGESYRNRRPWFQVLKVDERERDARVIEGHARAKREYLLAKAADHHNLVELTWALDHALELARIEAA